MSGVEGKGRKRHLATGKRGEPRSKRAFSEEEDEEKQVQGYICGKNGRQDRMREDEGKKNLLETGKWGQPRSERAFSEEDEEKEEEGIYL